ncbi:hypothetical protein SF1_41750 [Sphingobacterium faecium NBRC 15299]|nr:hypothetical protein SF1_41750 [Sphingobacterium faecium NBRC 15299]
MGIKFCFFTGVVCAYTEAKFKKRNRINNFFIDFMSIIINYSIKYTDRNKKIELSKTRRKKTTDCNITAIGC